MNTHRMCTRFRDPSCNTQTIAATKPGTTDTGRLKQDSLTCVHTHWQTDKYRHRPAEKSDRQRDGQTHRWCQKGSGTGTWWTVRSSSTRWHQAAMDDDHKTLCEDELKPRSLTEINNPQPAYTNTCTITPKTHKPKPACELIPSKEPNFKKLNKQKNWNKVDCQHSFFLLFCPFNIAHLLEDLAFVSDDLVK